MKKIAVIMAVCVLASTVLAQGEENGDRKPMQGMMAAGPGMSPEAMIMRIIKNKAMVEEFGITEEQVEKLKKGMSALEKKKVQAQADLKIALMEQLEELEKEEIDEEAALKATEKVGNIRTKQAKLKIRQLILVKKTLTSDQLKAIRKKIREGVQKRLKQARREAAADRGRRGERSERIRHSPEKKDPPPPPPPPTEKEADDTEE